MASALVFPSLVFFYLWMGFSNFAVGLLAGLGPFGLAYSTFWLAWVGVMAFGTLIILLVKSKALVETDFGQG